MGAIRKLFTTGVGAAMLTKNNLQNAVAQRAQKGKEELTRVLAAEIKRFLEHVKLHEEIQKALTGLEIEASIRIKNSASQKAFRLKKIPIKKR